LPSRNCGSVLPSAGLSLQRSESCMTLVMICVACLACFALGHAHAVWQRHRFIQSLLSGKDAAAYGRVIRDAEGNVR
jgi:hypothetical protein